MLPRLHRVLSAVAFGWLVAAPAVFGQPIWTVPRSASSIGVEALKASFDQPGVAPLSSVWVFSGRTPIGERMLFELDVPLTHFGLDAPGAGPATALGNPYVGVVLLSDDLPVEVRLGARPRLSNRNAALFPALTADYDRLGAFQSDDLTVRGGVRYVHRVAMRASLRLRAEPIVLVNTIRPGARSAWFVSYGLQAMFVDETVEVLAGITGVARTSGEGDLGRRTSHQLGLTVSRPWGTLTPGLHLRLPVDGDFLDQEIDFVVGVSLFIRLD